MSGQRRPEVVADRIKAKRTIVKYRCQTCGAELMTPTVHAVRAQPRTYEVLVRQAFEKHQRETGCSGEPEVKT